MSIQQADESCVVDLALPRYARLGVLLPDIVDLVPGSGGPAGGARGWRLDRLRGGRCDEAMSLQENGVADGDVLLLSPLTGPPPGPLHDDLFRTVSGAAPTPPNDAAPTAAWACAGAMAAAALGYCGVAGGAAVPAGAVALITAGGCLALARRTASLTMRALALLFSCLAGFLAVPGPPGPPGIALGAAVGCAASVWLLRTSTDGVGCFTGTATALALVAVVTAPSLVLSPDLTAVGAVLGVLSLGVLTAAGRVAAALTGLRPAFPGHSPDPASGIDGAVAIRARRVFAGLVAGSAAAAASATWAVAVGSAAGAAWPPGVALSAVIAALLLLRSRFYVDAHCRAALGWCGLAGVAATVALLAISAPRHGGLVAVPALALAACGLAGAGKRGPGWSRGLDIVEYVLIAAVVPLAIWVAGVYGLVRSLSLG